MAGMNGIALAAVGGGALFLYAGVKNASVLTAVRNLIKGNPPGTGQAPAAAAPPGSNSLQNLATPQVAASASESQWIKDLLAAIGAPATAANTSSVADWIAHEKPAGQWSQWNNPLNTTQWESGSTSMNSVNVRAYPNLSVGLSATVTTLNNGHYPDILLKLRSGQGLKTGASRGLSTWSGGAYTSV